MACICGRSQALYLIAYEIFNWQMLSIDYRYNSDTK